jgi:hypothetical protein
MGDRRVVHLFGMQRHWPHPGKESLMAHHYEEGDVTRELELAQSELRSLADANKLLRKRLARAEAKSRRDGYLNGLNAVLSLVRQGRVGGDARWIEPSDVVALKEKVKP